LDIGSFFCGLSSSHLTSQVVVTDTEDKINQSDMECLEPSLAQPTKFEKNMATFIL